VPAKYKNPPLLKVKATLWWHIRTQDENEKSKLLAGSLYSKLTSYFTNIQISSPSHLEHEDYSSFVVDDENELVINIKSDRVEVISTNENYSWESNFRENLIKVFSVTQKLLYDLISPSHVHLALEYDDFFPTKELKSTEAIDYISDNLKLNINYHLLESLDDIDISLRKDIEGLGDIDINYFLGSVYKKGRGIILRFTFNSNKLYLDSDDDLGKWFENAHSYCSELFEKTIDGEIKENLEYDR
jgi:uncharacterized protein (TIGR04255 family)